MRPVQMSRSICLRCRRPASVCYCSHLASIPSKTRVVFLQHPRERRVAVGTCRMAHLSLPNSELHDGVHFDGHTRVEELAASGAALLFPGEGSRDASEVEGLSALIVVDGTWVQARKVVERNAVLRGLPRVGLKPSRPGNYRIRKEPAEHCLSTIEATVEVLGLLEREPDRFRPMLTAFEKMVDTQLEFVRSHPNPPRRKRPRHRMSQVDAQRLELKERAQDLICVYAEANSHPAGSGHPGPAEMIQLVATRPLDGARFEAVIAPRRPLASSAPFHTGLAAETLLSGESVSQAMERWRAFAGERALLCGWGGYAFDLLSAEGSAAPAAVDVRVAAARVLRKRPGGVEQAAALFGKPVEPRGARAVRRIDALTVVVQALVA
jgi:DTW domain-containing protein YfiP